MYAELRTTRLSVQIVERNSLELKLFSIIIINSLPFHVVAFAAKEI